MHKKSVADELSEIVQRRDPVFTGLFVLQSSASRSFREPEDQHKDPSCANDPSDHLLHLTLLNLTVCARTDDDE